ncbi:TnsA-like heteromeric transposase endonuclease subunit [Streptomyces goshikiensis]|uniref:TnsA-like heteromeric transposase endonuclease subunit n=1 Tax=Streptomyces goshikiensis TaxID=1942 RepID=UPI0036F83E27
MFNIRGQGPAGPPSGSPENHSRRLQIPTPPNQPEHPQVRSRAQALHQWPVIAGRPVRLLWRDEPRRVWSWTPQLFARRADGTALLADCPSHTGGGGERALAAAVMMERACEQVGWSYRRLEPLDAVLAANLRWLAGYRHPLNQIRPNLTAAVLAAFARPCPLIDGVEAVGDPIEVLPAAFHALWHGHLSVPLERPLHERVLVQPGILPPSEAVRAAGPHAKAGGRFREGP